MLEATQRDQAAEHHKRQTIVGSPRAELIVEERVSWIVVKTGVLVPGRCASEVEHAPEQRRRNAKYFADYAEHYLGAERAAERTRGEKAI